MGGRRRVCKTAGSGAEMRVIRQFAAAGGVPMYFQRKPSSSVSVRMREALLVIIQWSSPGNRMSS